MDFLKNFFKDDNTAVGLCHFRKKSTKQHQFMPNFYSAKNMYYTNTKENFLLS